MPAPQPNALKIQTFDNSKGGTAFFKAVGHPLALPKIKATLEKLQAATSIAIFDPNGFMNSFAEIHDCSSLRVSHAFVQKWEDLQREVLGKSVQPVTELANADAAILLVAVFDAERLLNTIRHLIPSTMSIVSFDEFRLADEYLTQPRNYLSPLNFATNFAFMRDQGDLHTRLISANYWTAYSQGKPIRVWMHLMDEQGKALATWAEDYSHANQTITIDSQEIRQRFALGDFVGQLFMHVLGAAGHDVVKYALDVYSNDGRILSCTHDANSWPADFYAGLPAPAENERVILWVQNSHPCPIPAEAIGLALMGSDEVHWFKQSIPPFGTLALDTRDLFHDVRWPEQFEIYAGKYFVRPRYEVMSADNKQRIAHANVERTDLQNDPTLAQLEPLFGKGFILPAPILPREFWRSIAQPTPMCTQAVDSSLALLIYDKNGQQIADHRFGHFQRNQSVALEVEDLLKSSNMDFGHMELAYDFNHKAYADGWLHALFRYHHKVSGQAAETSFGAHIFNTMLTYKQEPQSYTGNPPGLSTRLFLCLGKENWKTLCHLIYPASTAWHPFSNTQLILHNALGEVVATHEVKIACSGSLFWVVEETFDKEALKAAGRNGYVLIRDVTCRLFGYHGVMNDKAAFGFDHMFGF